jgi:hypothetical protein
VTIEDYAAIVPRLFLNCLVAAVTTHCALSLAAAPTGAADKHWIADAQGCKVYNRSPLAKESVTWSGACVDGYADGDGKLSWFQDGKPNGIYAGRMSAGRLDGMGIYHYQSGDQYEGGFYAGEYDGHGVYRFANGNRYEGEFVEGISTRQGTFEMTDGQRFETDLVVTRTQWSNAYSAQPTLLVICFDDRQRLTNQVMFRSSGVPLFDEQAMNLVRIRPFDVHGMANDPIPGCHMLGVGLEYRKTRFIRPRK